MKDNQASAATATPIEISLVSDQACLLQFSNVISDAVADQISLVTTALRELEGIIDLIPSYTTLLVVFDTSCFDRFAIQKALQGVLVSIDWSSAGNRVSQEVVIPVYYGPEVGPDLEDVAKHCQLDTDEVIRLHSTTTYRAYAIGFTPGFAFLGNTPEALHVPRKTTPRLKVPIGSVAIAERQTAVYPSVTPGGWQILGRTPIALVNCASDILALINA